MANDSTSGFSTDITRRNGSTTIRVDREAHMQLAALAGIKQTTVKDLVSDLINNATDQLDDHQTQAFFALLESLQRTEDLRQKRTSRGHN